MGGQPQRGGRVPGRARPRPLSSTGSRWAASRAALSVAGAPCSWPAPWARTVERIDPESGTVTWTSQLAETGPVAMAYGDGGLWVADSTDQDLLELGPMSGSVLRTFSLDVHPTSIALAGGLVWVAAYSAGPSKGSTLGPDRRSAR